MPRPRPHPVVAVLAAAALAGCASAPPQAAQMGGARVLDASAPASCSLIVYRTQSAFHSMNLEKPFLFVDEHNMGTLDPGASLCLALAPGTHRIAINEPVPFMPGWASGQAEVTTPTPGGPVYLRYAKEYGGVAGTGAGATVQATGKLRAASAEEWMARK